VLALVLVLVLVMVLVLVLVLALVLALAPVHSVQSEEESTRCACVALFHSTRRRTCRVLYPSILSPSTA